MINFDTLLASAPQSVRDLLEGLKRLRENPEYHPEPNTFEHIKIVTERLVDTGDVDLIVSGFFHDLFKLKTAIVNEKTQHPSSPYHDIEVAAFIRSDKEAQDFIKAQGADVEVVAFICEQHMRVKRMGEMRSGKCWSLMSEELFPKLCLFTLADKMSNDWADCFGRWKSGDGKDLLPIGDVTFGWVKEEQEKRLDHLKNGFKSKHRLNGKDLIDLGFPQGIAIGMAIKLADEQLSDMTIGELLERFSSVVKFPETYLSDEALGGVAAELIRVKEVVFKSKLEEANHIVNNVKLP